MAAPTVPLFPVFTPTPTPTLSNEEAIAEAHIWGMHSSIFYLLCVFAVLYTFCALVYCWEYPGRALLLDICWDLCGSILDNNHCPEVCEEGCWMCEMARRDEEEAKAD